MEKVHTPGVAPPDRTVFRFTRADTIAALTDYVVKHGHGPVPEGTMSVVLPLSAADSWTASLVIKHNDPPPAQEEVDDE